MGCHTWKLDKGEKIDESKKRDILKDCLLEELKEFKGYKCYPIYLKKLISRIDKLSDRRIDYFLMEHMGIYDGFKYVDSDITLDHLFRCSKYPTVKLKSLEETLVWIKRYKEKYYISDINHIELEKLWKENPSSMIYFG